jgi:L-histidine N-alpha-methyltransferase
MAMTAGIDDRERRGFAADVRAGLGATRKVLSPRYFYDALGTQLFEAICLLPWYPITRVETRLLDRSAAEMVACCGEVAELCELGSGSGEKLARVARPVASLGKPFDVHLIDVSEKALELGRGALGGIPGARVVGHRASYEAGLSALGAPPRQRRERGARLICFFGSNIGNFDPPAAAALLAVIRSALGPGDGLLLGADLVRAEAALLLAYDDPLGVTAAFNKNVLCRINAELDGDFDLDAFAHHARWDARAARVEMHLVSRRRQSARVAAAGITASFEEGETIWTESSYKHTPEGLRAMGRTAGMACRRQWVDAEGSFATTLFVVD